MGDVGDVVGCGEGRPDGWLVGCWEGWPVGNIVGMTLVTPMWIAAYAIMPTDCSYTLSACRGHTKESMLTVMGQFLANALLHLTVGTSKSGWLITVNARVVLGMGNKHVTVIVRVSRSALPTKRTVD